MKNDSEFSLFCPFLNPSGWNLPRAERSCVLALTECKAVAKGVATRKGIRSLLKMHALDEKLACR